MFSMLDTLALRGNAPSEKDKIKIKTGAKHLIDQGRYSDLVTYAGLLAGHYNMNDNLISKLLYYTENFSTAMDYDTATDYTLWLLVRQYQQKDETPPAFNQIKAKYIIDKSKSLHKQFPNNCYFNKYSFEPINHMQAERLAQYIRSILKRYGVKVIQYHLFNAEFRDFLNE